MKQQLVQPTDIEIEEVENILDANKNWGSLLNFSNIIIGYKFYHINW